MIFTKYFIAFFLLSSNYLITKDTIFATDSVLNIGKSVFKFYDNTPIYINQNEYNNFIDSIKIRFTKSWTKLLEKIEKESQLSIQDINNQLLNQDFCDLYTETKTNRFVKNPELFKFEEDIHPAIVHFIKKIISTATKKQNIKIILTNNIPVVASTFGSDLTTHYLLCNANIFTLDIIKLFYKSFSPNNYFFHIERISNSNKYRFIEIINLLLCSLLEIASHIEHQSNIFTFLLLYDQKLNNLITSDTLNYCWMLTSLRGQLESIMQTHNPLESVFFLAQGPNNTSHEQKTLKKLYHNISKFYDPKSLQKFHTITQKNQNQSL